MNTYVHFEMMNDTSSAITSGMVLASLLFSAPATHGAGLFSRALAVSALFRGWIVPVSAGAIALDTINLASSTTL